MRESTRTGLGAMIPHHAFGGAATCQVLLSVDARFFTAKTLGAGVARLVDRSAESTQLEKQSFKVGWDPQTCVFFPGLFPVRYALVSGST